MKKIKVKLKIIGMATLALLLGVVGSFNNVRAVGEGSSLSAISSIALSPMLEKVVLNPGDKYNGSFKVSVPADATAPAKIEVLLQNFYRDNDGNAIFEEVGNTGQILGWIDVQPLESDIIQPNEVKVIHYTVNVPETAPAGGQYVAITVKTVVSDDNAADDSTTIQEQLAIAYLLYAEISGDTVHRGEINEISLPSFLLDGDITGSALVKNTGNSYGTAIYKLQVFPIFSSEEIYTNEENPDEHTILPDRTLLVNTSMPNTPDIGLFNVVYTVEFEGVTAQVSKLVVKCPLWLLFVILLVIIALIIWIIVRVRSRKKSQKSED